MAKAIVLVSGGMDSAVCLAMAVQKYGKDNVKALSMHYGQTHDVEQAHAIDLCKHYDVEMIMYDVRDIFTIFDSSLIRAARQKITDDGHTYVPARNLIFLSIAAGIAESIHYDEIWYGAHADDAAGYPDTTPSFLFVAREAIREGTKSKVKVLAPFINAGKHFIVKVGMDLGVPFEKTWSCYQGGFRACGVCPTCKLRLKAFLVAGFIDPIEYEGESI